MLSLLLRPLLGGVIGYITNDIAIRMLFRPHTAKYVCGIHVPFTPGIIPKERGRIAAALGESICNNLLNPEVMERSLLSEEMLEKLRCRIDRFFDEQRRNDETLAEFLCHYISTDDLALIKSDAAAQLSEQIHHKMNDVNLGNKISHIVIKKAVEKTKTKSGLVGYIRSKIHADAWLDRITEPAEKLLAKHVNELIRDNSATLVNDMLDGEIDKFLDQPVRVLLEGREDKLLLTRDRIIDLYRSLITERLPHILHTIDISRIIENRINEMDMDEAEKIIHDVMDKELKAVIWFGALLGMVIGALGCLGN